MSEITNTATIKVVADATGVEAGLRQATDAAHRAGQAVAQVGNGASASTRAVETAQRSIIASIQRTTTAMEAGGRSTAAYYELLARQKGVDSNVLAPYIAQLRAVEEAQTRAAQAAAAQQAAQQQATESSRAQAAAQRELAQAQAGRDNFLSALREQIALFGRSTEEVLRFRAAQADAAQAAAPLILQLQNMRAAQEQAEAAARAQAAAQREAAQAEASRNGFLDGLREQITLFGRSTEEVLQYRAAQLGAANAAAPLIAQLRALREAQEQTAAAARAAEQAQRDAQQAQGTRDSFLAGLREQISLFGKSTDETLRYQAAQIGAASAAEPLIQQLRSLRDVQDQATAAARAAEQAQRDAQQIQGRKDSFLADLREQIALYGLASEEVQRYRAAQLGLANVADPLISQLRALRSAEEQAASAARANEQAQREAAQVQAGKDNFVAGLREQIALFGLSTDEALRYRAAQLGVAAAAEPLIAQLQAMRIAQDQVTAAARAQAEAQRAAQRVQSDRDSFVAELQQQADAIGRTRLELLELRAAQLGVTSQAAPLIQRLREAQRGLDGTGLSAAQTAAALRGVPAQFTDIIVSLQGGQAPLTVLLQQGGQLKDMFGGAGNAAKALGGYVLGLVNPYTIAAVAVGGLAYAYSKGHEEAIAFGREIALSGNAAGTSVNQLMDAARTIRETTSSTKGAAAEALGALVDTGAVSSRNLQQFATVALQVERVLGKAVTDTASEFAGLRKAPLEGLQKLGEQYHFVTAATFAQVKALQEEGRMEEAAALAQNTYADEMAKRTKKVLENMGTLQRGWMNVADWAKKGWDAILDIGRKETPTDEIGRIANQINLKETGLARREADGEGNSSIANTLRAEIAQLKERKSALEAGVATEKRAGEEREKSLKAEELRKTWLGEQNILLTRQQLLKRDLAAEATKGRELGLSEEEIQSRLTVVRRKYNDVFVQGIDTNITALRKQSELQAAIDQRSLARIEAQRSMGSISDEDAINKTAQIELAALDRQKQLLQAQRNLTSQKIGSQREVADLDGQIAVADQQRANRKIQQENDISILQQRRAQESDEINRKAILDATAERDSLVAQVEAQFQANQEIGLSTKQVAELQAARMYSTATLKDQTAAELEAIKPGSELAAKYREQADALRDLADAKVRGATKQEAYDKSIQDLSAMVDIFSALDEAAQSAAQGMAKSFGTVGEAIGGMTTALTGYERTQAAIAAQLAEATKNSYGNPAEIARANQAATEASAQAQIKSYGDMAGAAKGFFDESSAGYKVLGGIEKAYRATEMVMALESMTKKIFFKETEVAANTALNATKLTGEAATTAASTGLAATEASAWGVTAVVKAIASLPFPLNLAAGAATLAAVVAIGAKMVGGLGGGSVSLSEQRQQDQGTGTVLGDSSAKSESIQRAIDAVEKNTYQDLAISTNMLAALRSIDSNIGNFASQVVQSTDVTGKYAATTSSFGGGFLGSVMSSIFGGKTSVQDTGFTLDATTLAQALAGGVNGMQYTDLHKSGGWFSSGKDWTDSKSLGDAANAQFTAIIKSLADSVKEAGALLGVSGDDFTNQLNSFVIDIGKVSLKDLKGDELQKALESVFSKLGDQMAQFAIGGLQEFQQVGEGYLETLVRVASEYQAIDVVFQSFGKTFGAVGLASIGARDRLVQLAGGLDEFTSQGEYFLTNFFSEQEQAAALKKRIDPTLAQYGLSTEGEGASKALRDFIVGLDTTTESGAQAYTALMAIAPAFKQIVDAAQDVLDERKDLLAQLDDLTLSPSKLRDKKREDVDDSNKSLYDQVQAAQAAKDARALEIQIMGLSGDKAGELAANRALELANMAESLRPLQQRIYDLQDEASALESSNSLLQLQAQIYELTGDKAGAAAVLQQQHAAALAALDPALRGATQQLWDLQAAAKATERVKAEASALLGGVDSAFSILQKVVSREKDILQKRIDSETEAVNRLKSLTETISSTLDGMNVPGSDVAGRQAAQEQIRAALASVKGGAQLSDDQIKSLGKALGAVSQDSSKQFGSKEDYLFDFLTTRNDIAQLGDLTGDQLSAEEKSLEALQEQSKALDDMLAKTQEQIDVLKGISTTGLSIEQALYGVQTAIVAAQQNSVAAAAAAIAQAYQDALGRAPDSAGMEFWQGQAAAGTSLDDITGSIKGSSEAQIRKLYKDLLGRSADASGLAFYLKSGASLSEIAAAIKSSDEYKKLHGVPGFALGGFHAGGLRIVGENGPELEATGPARIWSSNQTAALLARASSHEGNNTALVEAVKDLKAENAKQRGVIETMAKDMTAMAAILKGVSPNGTFIKTRAN